MFALFLALSVALTLLLWAELGCPRLGILPLHRRLAPTTPPDGKDISTAKTSTPQPDLPVISVPREELPSPLDALHIAERQLRRSTRLILEPEQTPPVAEKPIETESRDEEMWKRFEAMLHAPEQGPSLRTKTVLVQPPQPVPEPVAACQGPDDDLPCIDDLAPGERLELELDGPAPARESIRFEQVQGRRRTRVVIEDEAVLILENTDAAALTPDLFQFRAPRAV